MKKIIINTNGSKLSRLRIHAILQRLLELEEEENQAKKTAVFQPEPITITNHRLDFKPTMFYEQKPSKYFDKPKNNFKKR